jgi:hypothetical protein
MENIGQRRGGARGGSVNRYHGDSVVSKAVISVFAFVRLAEFEILFILFFVIAFLIFKHLVCVSMLLVFFLDIHYGWVK